MAVTPLVGTLGYVFDRASDSVLLIRRTARLDDDAYGKVNGLGGKLELDESVSDCLRRELREEAGIELTSFRLRGTVTWSGFGPRAEDWLGFIFLIDGWDGEPAAANAEGTLEWVSRADLLAACAADDPQLPMWPGDHHFLPLVFETRRDQFHGTMPYRDGAPLSWSVEWLATD